MLMGLSRTSKLERELSESSRGIGLTEQPRDSKGISELPLIQLVLPYKISWIRGSSDDVPLLSLEQPLTATQEVEAQPASQHFYIYI